MLGWFLKSSGTSFSIDHITGATLSAISINTTPPMRPESNATPDKDRSFPVPVTGTTGAFLAIHLLTSSADLSASLGLGGSGAAVGLVCNDEVVHGLAALGTISDELNLGLFGVLNCEC